MYREKNILSKNELLWDIDSSPINYPPIIRKQFEYNFCKNRKSYNLCIDKFGKLNNINIDWWMTLPSYRNPYISDIFNYLVVLDTLKSFKNKNINIKIVTSSEQFSKLVTDHFKKSITVEIKKRNIKALLIKEYIKSVIFQLIVFVFINLFVKKKYQEKKIIIVDQFVTLNKKQNSNFYRKFSNTKHLKTLIAPTLIPTMNFVKLFKNLMYSIKKNNNYIFKEHYLKLSDLIFSFSHIFRRKKFFKKEIKYKNFKLSNLLIEETQRYSDFFSINAGILNYIFFKRSSLNKLDFVKSINWFENQIVDRGWNLGFRTFYPRHEKSSFGYQDFSKHYNLMSNSPTEFEYKSKTTPEKLIIISSNFKKVTKEFHLKQKLIVGDSWRFKNLKNLKRWKNKKRKIILLVLCGIKKIDIELIKIVSETCKLYSKLNVVFKTHPILDIKNIYYKNDLPKNLNKSEEDLQNLLKSSLACITSGPSSTIFENSKLGLNTILVNIEAGTKENIKMFNLKKKNYFIIENSKQLLDVLKKLKKL